MSIKTDVKDLLDRALIELVLDFPIFSQLITRIGIEVVDKPEDDSIAWTDGKRIYINEATIIKYNADPMVVGESGTKYNRSITKLNLVFILCHELMHLIGLTFERGANMGVCRGAVSQKDIANFRKWNKATDYEINSMLHNNISTDPDSGKKKHKSVGDMPELALYESKYIDKDAETIYKELPDEKQDPDKPSFDGNDTGNGKDGLPGLDAHIPIQDDTTRNEVIGKIAEVLGSRTQGTGSSAMDRLIAKTFKPMPFNWKRALTKYIRSWMKDNFSWNKPSRAGIANGLILPSSSQVPKMNIAVAVDTSGSISDVELSTMMNHLFTILSQFKDFQVDLWCVSTHVHEETFMSFNASNKKELANYRTMSDGGTDLRTCLDFMKKKYKATKPDLFIMMTDGHDSLNGDTEATLFCPMIWMIIDNPNFKAPSRIKSEVYPFVVDID